MTAAVFLFLPVAHAQEDSRPHIIVAVNKLPRTLEPAEQTGNIEVRIHYSLFDTLLRRDFLNPSGNTFQLMPGLAKTWQRIDAQTIEFTLRRGVKFHNGDILTADDVVFTFSRERMTEDNVILHSGKLHFDHLKEVVKVDDHTVRFVTTEPDLLLEQKLAGYAAGVINARSWLKYKNGQTDWKEKALEANRWAPVGTGPLKFNERIDGEKIAFSAHDSYFLGRPDFQSVTFQEVPERVARIAGLISGKYDIIVDVSPQRIPVLKKYPGLDARSVILDNAHVLVFNTNSPKLKDKRLRKALSLAINRDELRRELWQNANFTPKGHQLPSFGSMYNPQRPGYLYDVERAKELVMESGYDGERLSYRLIPNYYLHSVNAALMIIEMWRRIGVNAKLELVETWEEVRDKDREIYAWSNTTRLPDPVGGLLVSWGPKSRIQSILEHWLAPSEFNKLASVVEHSADPQLRYSAFQRMLDIFEDEMPGTILYNPLYTYGVKSNIEWTPYPLYFMDFRPDVFSIRRD
jgi:peptide/nickel transport system substrate-binding protein